MTTTVLASPVLAPQIFPEFKLNTTVDCGTITYTSNNTFSFVNISSTARSITVNPTLTSELGIYPTSIIGSLDNYPNVTQNTVTFTINVIDCQVATFISQVNVISNGTMKNYQIGDPAATYIFYYDQTPACGFAYSFSYTVNNTSNPALSWITVN
jgi:hypothetical protein